MISHLFSPRHMAIFAFVALLATPALPATEYPELNDARITTIAQMLPAQPAGFGVPCSDRAAWKPIAKYYQESVQKAETFIASPLPAWEDAAYLRYSRDGDRKDGEAMLGRHIGQLGSLVLAECSEWKGRFLPRIAEQLDAISADRSWTLPAHDPKLENFNGTRYYVDLGSAGLGHNVAEALYLLGDKIPQATRQRAMAALQLHVFGPMRDAFAGRAPTYISWLTAKHNWNSVCLNGVTGAALTILPDRKDRALFAAAAEHWSGNYLDSFTDTGYDNEGIGYWDYGFAHYEELREQLWLSTNGKLDLFDNPKARKAALFGFQFGMLPGVYADYGDAHFMLRPDPMLLATIDRIFRLNMFKEDLGVARTSKPQSLTIAVLAGFPNHSERNDSDAGPADLIGVRSWYSEPGILVDRPAPGGNLAVTIKAGGNGNHSHNDVGSYSIGLRSTQITGDPGGPSFYNQGVFSTKRYDSRLLNSFGHPVPTIDGKLQLEATTVHPKVVSTRFTPEEDTIEMDITAAYNAPNLQKLIRTMRYSREAGGSIEIADQFDIAGPSDIEESFPTHGTCRQIDPSTLQFDFEGTHLQVTIDAPVVFTITQDKVDDYANPFIRIGARLHLAQSGKVVMRFREVKAN